MFSKVIVQGRLDFGNSNTYDKAVKLYTQRKDTYYKNDVIFSKPEEVFNDVQMTFVVKRFNGLVSDKYWRNTVNLLKNLAEYSLTGRVEMWMLLDGKVTRHELIRPSNDKNIVSQFNKANDLVNEKGDLNKAMTILEGVLEKYDGHTMALALMGRLFAKLGNSNKSIDFLNRALTIDPYLSEAYLWKAKLLISQENYADAAAALEKVTEYSNAQQNIHWIGRRLKGKCYFHLLHFDKAVFEWNLFTKKNFEKGNSNHYWKRTVTFGLGKAHMKLGQNAEAILSFNHALDLDALFGDTTGDEIMEYKNAALGIQSGIPAIKTGKRSKKPAVQKITV